MNVHSKFNLNGVEFCRKYIGYTIEKENIFFRVGRLKRLRHRLVVHTAVVFAKSIAFIFY